MRPRPRSLLAVRVITAGAALTALLGCAPGVEGDGTGGRDGGAASGGRGAPGSGGVVGAGGASGGSGGAPGSGGRVADSGGASGSGGRVADSGGASASGGRPGSGGAPGSGGRTAGSGGAPGSGGRASSGGTTGASGGTLGGCSSPAPSGGTQHCSSNMSGNLAGGYQYTIWSSGSGGCITPYGVGAAFKATWNNSGDFLARVGLALTSNKTFDQYGAFAADFSETKSGSAGGFSYIGIYGWSVNPLIEYYIIDDWFGSRPNPGTKVGSITVDGGTYDILTKTQTNQPSIMGTQTFQQFWSLRTTPRTCGHISISEHFKAWKSMGMTLGNMYEVKILIEAGGGMGSIDFTSASVTAQ